MASKLVCTESFSAWGDDFKIGDSIPVEKAMKWPDGAFQRRLDNGFMKFVAVADEVAARGVTGEVVKDLDQMTKAELIDYAGNVHSLELDAKMSIDDMRTAIRLKEGG